MLTSPYQVFSESSDGRLEELVHDLPVLKDFMKHNRVTVFVNTQKGTFELNVAVSPWIWSTVKRELQKQLNVLLPRAFKKLSTSNLLRPVINLLEDTMTEKTMTWQQDALKRGVFDSIPDMQ